MTHTSVTLTRSQKMALYVLLSTQSQLRLLLEGRITLDGSPAPGPSSNQTDLSTRLKTYIPTIGIHPQDSDCYSFATKLWAGSGTVEQSGNLTTSSSYIRQAFQMAYDPTGPCPKGADQNAIVDGLKSTLP